MARRQTDRQTDTHTHTRIHIHSLTHTYTKGSSVLPWEQLGNIQSLRNIENCNCFFEVHSAPLTQYRHLEGLQLRTYLSQHIPYL